MIGNGMSKVMRYAVITAVVLVVGTQFLTSAICFGRIRLQVGIYITLQGVMYESI